MLVEVADEEEFCSSSHVVSTGVGTGYPVSGEVEVVVLFKTVPMTVELAEADDEVVPQSSAPVVSGLLLDKVMLPVCGNLDELELPAEYGGEITVAVFWAV